MKKTLDPIQILESFSKKEISKEEALNFLITILEKSENSKLRINSMRIIGNMSYKNEQIFRILENCLISDEIPEIRALSSEIILTQYFHEGLNTLIWAIRNEQSAQVLSHLNSILNKNIKPYSTLRKTLDLRIQTIASNFDIKIEEIQFLLNLGIQLNTNNLITMENRINCIYQENLMCVIKDNHIMEINLTSYPAIPNSIGNLTVLDALYLSCNNFYELPKEFINLTNLKILDLSWNEFKKMPDELLNLHYLQELNMSNNFITEVPDWISSLENLEYLNIKGNQIKNIPNSIENSTKIKLLY